MKLTEEDIQDEVERFLGIFKVKEKGIKAFDIKSTLAAHNLYKCLIEVMNSRYNARLVVLAACDSGLGKPEQGEGVTGLTRAVMYAGSPAVVVSLCKVSDPGTRDLMVRFYKNMIKKGWRREMPSARQSVR